MTASARLSDIVAVWMKSKNHAGYIYIYVKEENGAGATCIVNWSMEEKEREREERKNRRQSGYYNNTQVAPIEKF